MKPFKKSHLRKCLIKKIFGGKWGFLRRTNYSSENGVLFDKSKTTLICYPRGKTVDTYIVPNSVTTIGWDAFYACTSLISITIPNSVTTIGDAAFRDCSSLTSITIPNSVTTIGVGAFSDCTSLTSITNLNLIPVEIDAWVFSGVDQSACTLTVATSAVSAYQNAKVWKEFNIVSGGFLVNPTTGDSEQGYTIGDGLYGGRSTATVTAVANDGYRFVNWTKNGSEVSKANPYSFTVTEDIELVANFEEGVGIDEWRIENGELRIYPNPTRGELQVTSYELQVTGIEIFDVMGRIVGQSQIGQSDIALNIAHLPNGVYFLHIQTENGVVVRKVVKK